jgi:molecular chaperone DnaK
MVNDAQSHAADDEAKRELIDVRNQADSLAYQVEKSINENRDKVPAGELTTIEAAIAQVRRLAQTEDVPAIKRATEDLQRLSHGFAEKLYKGSQGSHGTAGSQGSEPTVKDAEIVDGEFAETR